MGASRESTLKAMLISFADGSSRTSSITTILLSIIASFMVVGIVRSLRRRVFLLPPGPWFEFLSLLRGLISKSNLPRRLERTYTEYAKTYGQIFSFSFGRVVVVILNDPDVIREAFVKKREIFNNRETPKAYSMTFGGKNEAHRIIFGNGRVWKTARRVVGPCLRSVGTWGERMESLIISEANYLTDTLASFAGQPFDPSNLISTAIADVIYALVHGYRVDYADHGLQEMIHAFDVVSEHPFTTFNQLRFLPFLFYLPQGRSYRRAALQLQGLMTAAVAGQEKSYDRDNIKSIIHRIMRAAQDDDVEEGENRMKTTEVWRILWDLMLAGTDTTANTLRWALLAMAHNPDVQQKVHEEVDRALGDRSLSLKDRDVLPFTRATLMEVLRIRPLAPLAVPHVTTETTVLRGYTIPKGATVVANIWACHHDAAHWDDPEAFDPNRFLTEDGQVVAKEPAAYMPFGVGARMCLGDQLARNELFLMFTTIMRRFDIDFAPGDRPDFLDHGIFHGILLKPATMRVRMIPRAQKIEE